MGFVFERIKSMKHRDLVFSCISVVILLSLHLVTGQTTHFAIYIFIMLFSLVVIIVSADVFLKGARDLAKIMGVSEFLLGLTLVSVGTSLPEIASTGMASYRGEADLAIGNIYGSVLVQITFIMGIVVLFCPVKTEKTVILRDGLCMLGAVLVITLFTFWDKELTLWESIVLIILYVVYIAGLVFYYGRKKKKERDRGDEQEAGEILDNKKRLAMVSFIFLAIGLAMVIYGAQQMVESATVLSEEWGVKKSVIGTSITAFGTSVPELIVAIVAIRKAKGLALGTLIGSNITDPLLSIGIAGVINPIKVIETVTVFHFLVPMTIIACVVALWFMRTGFKLSRFEGSTLVFIYLIAIIGLFLGWHFEFSSLPFP